MEHSSTSTESFEFLIEEIRAITSFWSEQHKAELDDSDSPIAFLHGPQVNDGTAWEIGCYHLYEEAG